MPTSPASPTKPTHTPLGLHYRYRQLLNHYRRRHAPRPPPPPPLPPSRVVAPYAASRCGGGALGGGATPSPFLLRGSWLGLLSSLRLHRRRLHRLLFGPASGPPPPHAARPPPLVARPPPSPLAARPGYSVGSLAPGSQRRIAPLLLQPFAPRRRLPSPAFACL